MRGRRVAALSTAREQLTVTLLASGEATQSLHATSSLGNWQLFDGCVDHETAPFEGTRISFIAFSHMAYNKLPPDVVAELRALGFTAAASDGVDDPYFEKFRIDRSVLGEADRAK